jgi:type II secretory pathway pseudopilin PulG
MTLIETLLVVVVVGIVLLVIARQADSVRDGLKRNQTRQCLMTLDEALSAYHQASKAWPVLKPKAVSPRRAVHARLHSVIDPLRRVAASRQILEKLPAQLWFAWDESDTPLPRDAWGNPLRCLTASSPREADRYTVAAYGGRPVFISAGPDGDFGFEDPVAATDNIVLPPTATTDHSSSSP